MNLCEPVEVENKKNNDSFSLPCCPVNLQCLSQKLPIGKAKNEERKREKKKENTDRTQTKLNALYATILR